MSEPANRAFILTPPGAAAIAVVRLRGPAVPGFLSRHFNKPPTSLRAIHGSLFDGARILDDPVIVILPDGLTVDINLHGGAWLVRSVLELTRQNGFVLASNTPADAAHSSPLPSDAVDADGEIERDILTHIPLARTGLGVRALLAQKQAWEQYEPSQQDIINMRHDWSLWWLLHPPRVAIVGEPNVGKSTLANQLFAQERSITADVPGTTRDWVGEIAEVDGLAVMLVDTPGLRRTEDPIEAQAIARAGEQVAGADLVIVVIDASRDDLADQIALRRRYPDAICVLNKWDRAARADREVPPGAICTVATTGAGIDALRSVIRQRFGCENFDLNKPRLWKDADFL